MNKKSILSVAFIISLAPMLLNQYGGLRGVSEVSGMINLLSPNAFPIGVIAIVLFFIGVWVPFEKQSASIILGAIGVIGIVVAEIYTFFTWHILTITGEISLKHSIRFAFPEFYLGFAVSLLMVAVYFVINKKIED